MIDEGQLRETLAKVSEMEKRMLELSGTLNSALTDIQLMSGLLEQADDFLATICAEPGIGPEALSLRKHMARMMKENVGTQKSHG